MKCEVELRRNRDRTLAAGETLAGKIIIKLNNLSCINEISCQIVGYAKCAWSVESSISSMHIGRVELLNANLLILHKPRNGQYFQTGIHPFPFSYQLPTTLPTSFQSPEGCVKYKMLITVKRLGRSSSNFEYPFTVRQVIDLNSHQELTRPLLRLTSKEFTIDFTSKCLYMTAMISQQGFTPNQIMDIRIQVDNRSIVHVRHVKISLKRIVTFTAQSPSDHQHKVESTEAVSYCGDVAAHEKRLFIKYLKIPAESTPNIDNCPIINLSYEVQVKAKTAGATRSPVLRLPIRIGTIQLFADDRRDYEMDVMEPRILEFAPMSYDQCVRLGLGTTPGSGLYVDGDLIDLNLPSYDEAIKLNEDPSRKHQIEQN